MSTSVCWAWELPYDGLMSRLGGDSHLLNTTETGDMRRAMGHLARKGFS